MPADLDLATMLRELGDAGWKPILYAEPRRGGYGMTQAEIRGSLEWVCYPMAAVRRWESFRAPDPVGAVRALWRYALEHPNVPPAPPADMCLPGGAPPVSPPAPAQTEDPPPRRPIVAAVEWACDPQHGFHVWRNAGDASCACGARPITRETPDEHPTPWAHAVRQGAGLLLAVACVGVLWFFALLMEPGQ